MAAKIKVQTSLSHRDNPKRKRKGVHAKTKTSKSKNSKHYKKLSIGQG